jgi:hypothetical protein
MGKLKISSEEKNQILESHNKYRDVLMGHLFDRSLVSEQATSNMPAKQLFALAKQYCKSDSPIALATQAQHLGKDVLKYRPTSPKEGVWDVGDDVYFYADGTYVVVTKFQGKERVKTSRQWNCPNLPFERDRVDNLINTLRSDYKYFLLDDPGFKEYRVPAQQNNDTVLDIIQVGDTLLYRPKTGTMQPGPTTTTETNIINSYLEANGVETPETGRGPWKYEKDMTESERQTWQRVMIPKSAGLSNNIVIYFDPKRIDRRQLLKLVQSANKQTKSTFNEKYCGKIILGYYNTWKVPPVGTEDEKIDFGTLEVLKSDVQKCIRQGHNYGVLGLGGKNIDKAILALQEKYTGDPNFPSLPKTQSGRAPEKSPAILQVFTPNGEVENQFDFRVNR